MPAVVAAPPARPAGPAPAPARGRRRHPDRRQRPRGRDPAELAPAYVFLAAEQDSSYITGSVMDLTGGKMLP